MEQFMRFDCVFASFIYTHRNVYGTPQRNGALCLGTEIPNAADTHTVRIYLCVCVSIVVNYIIALYTPILRCSAVRQ